MTTDKCLLTSKQKISALEHAKFMVSKSTDECICPPAMHWISRNMSVIISPSDVPHMAIPELLKYKPDSPFRVYRGKAVWWWSRDLDGQKKRIETIDKTIKKIKEHEANKEGV